MASSYATAQAAQTFYLRALRGEGVTQFEPTPRGGGVSGLVGGGQMLVTGTRRWSKVFDRWTSIDDPPDGWAGLAFREYKTRRPLVMMSTVSHARMLAYMEFLAAESGRMEGE
jgi:hypothetical protein